MRSLVPLVPIAAVGCGVNVAPADGEPGSETQVGGTGLFYWEPAWITAEMRDLWGTGSSWDSNTLFDFNGALHEGVEFFTHAYRLER